MDKKKDEIEEIDELIEGAAAKLFEAALRLIELDPHPWTARPCATCNAVSELAGRPFGCARKMREERDG